MRFRGRDTLFMLVLSTLILPQQVTLIPQYLLFTKLGWMNTLWPLIVPYWFGGSFFNIFLIRQYMMTLPLEIDDAARIDGAGWLQLYSRIVLPRPPGARRGHDLQLQLPLERVPLPAPVLERDQELHGRAGAAAAELALHHRHPVRYMAQTIIAVIPVMLVFFFAQRFYIQGIVVTGVKG